MPSTPEVIPKSSAARVRRHRARRKRGVIAVVPINVKRKAIEGLVRAGLLRAEDAEPPNRKAIAQAIAEMYAEWAAQR